MEQKNSPRYADGKLAASAALHEVLVTNPNGHQSVVRVVAKDKAEAKKLVADSLPGERARGYEVTEVAGPAEMLATEAKAQREQFRQAAEAAS